MTLPLPFGEPHWPRGTRPDPRPAPSPPALADRPDAAFSVAEEVARVFGQAGIETGGGERWAVAKGVAEALGTDVPRLKAELSRRAGPAGVHRAVRLAGDAELRGLAGAGAVAGAPRRVHLCSWSAVAPLLEAPADERAPAAWEVAGRPGPPGRPAAPDELRWKPARSPADLCRGGREGREAMASLLPVFVDGCREQHEPYRYLALRATEQLLGAAAARGWLADSAEGVCASLRLALNTFEPRFVGLACHLLRHVLRLAGEGLRDGSARGRARREDARRVARTLLGRLRALVPVLGLYWASRERVAVPPKGCLPPTGSATARGRPVEYGSRTCRTCGKGVDGERTVAVRGLEGADGGPVRTRAAVNRADDGRPGVRTWAIGELVEETLRDVEDVLGSEGTRVIKSFMPTWENVTGYERAGGAGGMGVGR